MAITEGFALFPTQHLNGPVDPVNHVENGGYKVSLRGARA